jgi:prepilin-type processing-associated H-X9-DG protein
LKKRSKPSFTVIELLLVTVILLLIIGMLMPALALAREKARRTNCASNMKQIGLSLRSYAIDYRNWFPDPYPPSTFSTDTLEPKLAMDRLVALGYLTADLVYFCPSTVHDTRIDNDDHIVDPSHLYLVDDVGPLSELVATRDSALVADRRSNHVDTKGGSKYGNILYGDGRVEVFHGAEWWKTDRITKAMQAFIETSP